MQNSQDIEDFLTEYDGKLKVMFNEHEELKLKFLLRAIFCYSVDRRFKYYEVLPLIKKGCLKLISFFKTVDAEDVQRSKKTLVHLVTAQSCHGGAYMLDILLDFANDNVDAQDANGDTALHLAFAGYLMHGCKMTLIDCALKKIDILVKHCASFDIKNYGTQHSPISGMIFKLKKLIPHLEPCDRQIIQLGLLHIWMRLKIWGLDIDEEDQDEFQSKRRLWGCVGAIFLEQYEIIENTPINDTRMLIDMLVLDAWQLMRCLREKGFEEAYIETLPTLLQYFPRCWFDAHMALRKAKNLMNRLAEIEEQLQSVFRLIFPEIVIRKIAEYVLIEEDRVDLL